MVSGLDPHSTYLEPKAQKSLLESASGKFGGLGIVINKTVLLPLCDNKCD
jgi:carboxyl-terminal processing protease